MDKVIIVTGASRGIGLAVVNFLLTGAQSCRLVAVARTKGPLEDLEQKYGDRIRTVSGDLGDFSVARRAVECAKDTWGNIDGLVINHGRLEPVERVGDSKLEDWQATFNVNVFSAIEMVRVALPALRKSKGRIVFTSSGAATRPVVAWGAYGASKAVLNHLTMTLASEEPDIVTVALRPGVVDTEMQRQIATTFSEKMSAADNARFANMRADGKMLHPEQPGDVISRLVLRAPSKFSGRYMSWDDEDLHDFQM